MLFLFYVKVYVCRLYCIVLYCITLYYNLIKIFKLKKKTFFGQKVDVFVCFLSPISDHPRGLLENYFKMSQKLSQY